MQRRLQRFVDDEANTYNWKNPRTGVRKATKYKATDHLRISVVVLDARNGDLLTSAVYPLPDQQMLKSLSETELIQYSDQDKAEGWKAYTDIGKRP
jgi:hypothetical protein